MGTSVHRAPGLHRSTGYLTSPVWAKQSIRVPAAIGSESGKTLTTSFQADSIQP